MDSKTFEVIIIGGGAAGMSAAFILGRSRIKTMILNTEKPRNSVSSHSHGSLTQDGKHPLEILEIEKKQLSKYSTVNYRNEKAIRLESSANGFVIETENATYESKRVVIATGHKDNIEKIGIEGLKSVYGKSFYKCPFCNGFELADKKLALIGNPAYAKIISNWSKDLIVFTNGKQVSDEALVANLKMNGIQVIEAKIKKLHSEEGILKSIELEDGSLIEREGGFLTTTKSTEYTDFAETMEVAQETTRGMGKYKVDWNGETNIKGLYIIGDARTGWSGVAPSVAEGGNVASAITYQIIEENWKN